MLFRGSGRTRTDNILRAKQALCPIGATDPYVFVDMTGIEPATLSLQSSCTPVVLHAHMLSAERGGFEPPTPSRCYRVATGCLTRLGHRSVMFSEEEEGFEPPARVPGLRFSRPLPSAARPLFLSETWELWTTAFTSQENGHSRSSRVRASRVSDGAEGLEPSTDVGSEPTALPVELHPNMFSLGG